MEIYTVPSFLHRYENYDWIPILGGMLHLRVQDEFIVAMYNGKVVGLIPEQLTNVFKDFLQHSEIYVRCTGPIVPDEFGYILPASYIFQGNRETLHKLINDLNMQDVNSEPSSHTLSRIPPTGKTKYPTKRCVICHSKGIHRFTRYFCIQCKTAHCKDCFYKGQ